MGKRNRGRGKPKPNSLIRDPSWQPNAMASILAQLTAIAKSGDTAFGIDRAIAILLAAHLERAVELGITARLKNNDHKTQLELYSERGPLGTFSGKIAMAYALGMIDATTRAELDSIRAVRNAFAHATADISFSTDVIAAECKKLNPLRLMGISAKKIAEIPPTPRNIFMGLATFLFLNLWLGALVPISQSELEKALASGDADQIENAKKNRDLAERYAMFFPVLQSIVETLSKVEELQAAQRASNIASNTDAAKS